jgi:rare lipoprotein A
MAISRWARHFLGEYLLNRRKLGSVAAGAVGMTLCTFAVVKLTPVRAAQPAVVTLNPVITASPVVNAHPHVATRGAHQNSLHGLASWYGRVWNGRRTADGETFNDEDLTAASRTLPFGSRVRVSDVSTGRSVIVRINDRGTLAPGRIIDLSSAAAEILGILERGVATVKLEILHHGAVEAKQKPAPPADPPDDIAEIRESQ